MSELRIALLLADQRHTGEARTIRNVLVQVAPNCAVQTHAFDSVHQLNEESPRFARGVAAALRSDVVLFLAPERDARTNAALIALRERSGFTERFHEPEFARAWFTANGRRSLYVLGALPGALGALALALEYGCGDPDAARQLRGFAHGASKLLFA
jgi:hypothetical protein